ncbi:hypothetical protein Clacol_000909 [Clathrus columnatus]|uniref:Uncharacterized protein n=1 Tax=Clathrus columnatus TaxID=1419009 RepID=A0AAV5A0J3_9AGAM|nr:hypothetical protein Clacol_000909 [Clathrus columnatus]
MSINIDDIFESTTTEVFKIIPETISDSGNSPSIMASDIPRNTTPEQMKSALDEMHTQMLKEIIAMFPQDMSLELSKLPKIIPEAQPRDDYQIGEDRLSEKMMTIFYKIFHYLQQMQNLFEEMKDLYEQTLQNEATRLITLAHVLQHMMNGTMP